MNIPKFNIQYCVFEVVSSTREIPVTGPTPWKQEAEDAIRRMRRESRLDGEGWRKYSVREIRPDEEKALADFFARILREIA